jgi:hypothetical protein
MRESWYFLYCVKLTAAIVFAAQCFNASAGVVKAPHLRAKSLRAKPLLSQKQFPAHEKLQQLENPSSFLQLDTSLRKSGVREKLAVGAHVRVQGSGSLEDLNGRQGTVQAFDELSGRYVVEMTSGGPSRRITPEHLSLLDVSEINDDPVNDGDRFRHGTHVVIGGLRHLQALNGIRGVIRHFDYGAGRYIVEIPGQPPRRIKPANLMEISGAGSIHPAERSRQGMQAVSVCQGSTDDGPSHFSRGSKVILSGLKSAMAAAWNGMVATVHCFDDSSQRYVVAMDDGKPRKIKPINLYSQEGGESAPRESAGDRHAGARPVSVCQSASDDGPSQFSKGSKVILHGLRSAVAKAWNGMVATVHCFDSDSQRYVVAMADGAPRKIKPANLYAKAVGDTLPIEDIAAHESGSSRPRSTRWRQAAQMGGRQASPSCDPSVDDGMGRFPKGSKVLIHGLRTAVARPWNGLIATVHCYDSAAQRYLVQLPDGTPRKIKPTNLLPERAAGDDEPAPVASPQVEPSESTGKSAGAQEATSICKQVPPGLVGPGGLTIGTKVTLHGLKSAAALEGHWNGMVGVVHCFDAESQRYVVACPDGVPRKLKAANLMSPSGAVAANGKPGTKSICQLQAAKGFVGPGGLSIGMKVLLHGLTSPAAIKGGWNGMVGVIHCFDTSVERFVVACPDGVPRKLKLANLKSAAQQEQADALPLAPTSMEAREGGKRQSICAPSQGVADPAGLAVGTKVAVFGLTSKAALKSNLNGMVGVVHCYDRASQRYVVAMADGSPRKLKIENLAIVTSVVTQPVQKQVQKSANVSQTAHPVHWMKGAYVRLVGLKSAVELNGQVGSVVGFENTTQRYVVKVPGSKRLKRIRADNIADVGTSPSPLPPVVAAVAQAAGAPIVTNVQQSSSGRQLSVCNAYATHAPIQVVGVSGDGKHYTRLVKNLEFQSCADVENLQINKVASLAFVLGKFQVAKKVVDFAGLTPKQGLELVVHRNDPNSLKAVVHENPIEIGDTEAYYLHLVNAYAGRKNLELHVQRGKFLQKLSLDKTYRLSTEQSIKMVLSDGSQHLKLSFQPKHGSTYCVMTTGVDQGLKGEPRTVGLVAHQLGAWTSSEEMLGDDAVNVDRNSPPPTPEETEQHQEEDVEDLPPPKHARFSLSSVFGSIFGGSPK